MTLHVILLLVRNMISVFNIKCTIASSIALQGSDVITTNYVYLIFFLTALYLFMFIVHVSVSVKARALPFDRTLKGDFKSKCYLNV